MKKKFIDKIEQQIKDNIQKQDEQYFSDTHDSAMRKTTGKGWLDLVKNGEYEEYTGNLKLSEVEEKLKNLIDARIDGSKQKPVFFEQFCITNGVVRRTSSNLNLYNNPECMGCQALNKLVEEEFLK